MKKSRKDIAFLKKVKDTIEHYEMFDKGDRVLVAVSGGADSVCLVRSLVELRDKVGITLKVANMDHSLRGKESASDSNFVKRLAESLELEFVHKKVNITPRGKKGSSTEERAREKRYAFLIKAARVKKCNVIVTGHTMDDQAETVFMRVMCGSSLRGITGIPPVREEAGIRITRPLIRTSRLEIEEFLKSIKEKYVKDSTNRDEKFLRNKIRIRVLPYLKKQNPRIKRSLVNLADTLREDLVFLNKAKISGGRKRSDLSRISIKDIILQAKTVRKDIFKELFTKAGGNVKKLTYRHWMDMDRFLRSLETGKSLDFPGGIRVTKKRSDIVFAKKKAKKKAKE